MSDSESTVATPEAMNFEGPKRKRPTTTTTAQQSEAAASKVELADAATAPAEYAYIDLLERAHAQLAAANPDFGAKKRCKLPPPQVAFEGSKKTKWSNFDDICQLLHRAPEHVMSFLWAETGTNGALDGAHHLVIKGRFKPKQIESILRKYLSAYVTCPECQAPETELTRDPVTRVSFLECKTCTAKHPVQAIKAGFVADNRADRRKAKEAV